MIDNQLKAGVYPIEEYLDDVMSAAWKSLDGRDERQENFSRQLHRVYVSMLGLALIPNKSTDDKGKTTSNVSLTAANSDAVLYLLQHLDKVEKTVERQKENSTGINNLHYKDLLLRIKKIKGEYTKVDK